MAIPEIYDDTILLRPFKLEDADEHLANDDKENIRWLSGEVSTLETVRKWISKNQQSWENGGPVYSFAIVKKQDKQLIGMVEANADPIVAQVEGWEVGAVNISYLIYPFARRQGYGTRAVNLMCEFLKQRGYKKAIIRIEPENTNSLQIPLRNGFKETGFIPTKDGSKMLLFEKKLNNIMKLIILDGGPASGKNTLGSLLVKLMIDQGEKAILLDLDSYVEKYNPKWIWDSKETKEKDQRQARIDFGKSVSKHLNEQQTVIAICERILTRTDLDRFMEMITVSTPVYLFHLSIPLSLRRQRLVDRGPHSLIDLDIDQRDRDEIPYWPGCVYENISTPKIDAANLLKLIQENKGLIVYS